MNLTQYVRAQWDRVAGGVLFALGGLALVLGWIGVSKEALTALQIPYIISGGLGGIFLLGLGAVFWLSADLRDEWRKLDTIEAALNRNAAEAEAEPGVAPEATAKPAAITNGSKPSIRPLRREPLRASS